MRRWNGWGDESISYPVQSDALDMLRQQIGPGTPPHDVSLADVVAQMPASRLPAHPLVTTDAVDRVHHSRGQSLTDIMALRSGSRLSFTDGVAYPISRDQVCAVIDYATQTGVRLIPYGGGTSVVGHVTVLPDATPTLTVDLSRMRSLVVLDEASNLATFGAGITGASLEATLRAHGYTLGHFPQSFEYSTLGGWIATRSKGQQSAYYGGIERLFAGGTVETPSGTIELSPLPGSATGLDLREVVLGSEGRIGIITDATVRVSRLPASEEFHTVFLPSFEQGMAAVRKIAQERLPFSLLRLLNDVETGATLTLGGHPRTRQMLEWLLKGRGMGDGKCMLTFGATGDQAMVRLTVDKIVSIVRAHGGVHVAGKMLGSQWRKARFRTPYLRDSLWELGYAVDTVETAVDWASVPATMAAIESALKHALDEIDERVFVMLHLSHVYSTGSSIYATYAFRVAASPDETLHRWRILKDAASQAILENGGTISHQHGVGVDHLPYMRREKGEEGMAVIRAICAQFDPDGMMNPGKLVD